MNIKLAVTKFRKYIYSGSLVLVVGALLFGMPAAAAALEPTGSVRGRVTDVHNVPLSSIRVNAYISAADYNNGINNGGTAVAETAGDGTYTMENVPAGNYLIVFNQGGGGNDSAYATDFYDGQRSIGVANYVTVTAGATTADINATLTAPGTVTGKVTNTLGVGIANILVDVYATVSDYQNGILSAGYHTEADGTYRLSGLHAGTYIVAFNEPINMMYHANYETEFYNGQPTAELASPVVITADGTTDHIDATLTALAPTNKEQCKHDGWQLFTQPSFRNQGQCIRYVEHQDE